MFLLHTRWNHREISHILDPHNNEGVFYFSIIRDPVTLYRSYWDYFGLARQYETTLDEYAKTVISNFLLHKNMTRRPPGYNQMLHDFGMNFYDMIHLGRDRDDARLIKNRVNKKLYEIDQSFNFILLADDEHFEDGMVLLKHDLCWEFEDMINVKRNVFPKAHRSYLSENARKIIKGNTINAMCTY